MPIKTFRGQLANEQQDTIRISTNNGLTGYRIVKFKLMAPDANENMEGAVKIFTRKQTTFTHDIDFTDGTLLAAGLVSQSNASQNYPEDQITIFDHVIINQDIFIYSKGADYTANVNYYIEMEQIKLNVDEAAVATLKDMRASI
tara:strand:- start:155 stop:586 length:432 start_codon:yes stop_codon:yes gene_type:complete